MGSVYHVKLCHKSEETNGMIDSHEVSVHMWNDHNNGTDTVRRMAQFFKPRSSNFPDISGGANSGHGRLEKILTEIGKGFGIQDQIWNHAELKDEGDRSIDFVNSAPSCPDGWTQLWSSSDQVGDDPDETETQENSEADMAMMIRGTSVLTMVLCAVLFSN